MPFQSGFLHFIFRKLSVAHFIALFLSFTFSQCKIETYNPAVPYSKAWWETNLICVVFGTCSTPSTAVLQNIAKTGNVILETGFLVGTSTTDVEVSLDGGSFQPAVSTAPNWSFALPTGTSTWKLKSLHTIQIRDVGSTIGLTVVVRKGANKDINGDGYPDLIVGDSSYSSNTGQIYIFYNTGLLGITATSSGSANDTISGTSPSDFFGASYELADINSDGYADLVVGSEGYSSSTGRVYIFHSSGAIGITGSTGSASTVITGPTSSGLGHSLSTGDTNLDGYPDLAIGSPNYPSGVGTAYIYLSSIDGITDGVGGTSLTISNAASFITGPSSSNFGSGITFGDFNGDKYADLAVGSSLAAGQRGGVWVFISSGSAGIASPNSLYSDANTNFVEGYYFSRFGWLLVSDDFNRDGFDELVVGSIGFPSNGSAPTYAGRVSLYNGSPSGITGTSVFNISYSYSGHDGSYLGNALNFGDINGDGYPDFIVGEKAVSSPDGGAYIFYGSTSGITGSYDPSTAPTKILITGESGQTSQFGTALRITDLNADGISDLIVGAPSYPGGGKVYIFNGTKTPFVSTDISSATSVISGSGSFGLSL